MIAPRLSPGRSLTPGAVPVRELVFVAVTLAGRNQHWEWHDAWEEVQQARRDGETREVAFVKHYWKAR